MKSIAICGDSFNIGIGCRNLDTEPYGQILAKELNKSIINLAKGSSTNFSIYLQVKHVVENLLNDIDLVIVSHTSYDRVDWFPLDHKFTSNEITNADVNYHQYPPYGESTYHVQIDHPMKNNPKYNGSMYTENLMGVIDYWETFRSKDKNSSYYARFKNEPKERTKTLYDYSVSIHENRINRIHSIGLMSLAHQLLKRANINHLILTNEPDYYEKFIDSVNICKLCWGQLSLEYPDDLHTLHTGPDGHKKAFDIIQTKLKENNWV